MRFSCRSLLVCGFLFSTLVEPRLACSVTLEIASVIGYPGEIVSVTGTLHTEGEQVAGAQNDLTFDAARVTIALHPGGQPRCTSGPLIPAEAGHFAVMPFRCGGATPCTGLRVVMVSQDGILIIPDAAVLYTCQFKIVDDAAPGSYVLGVTNLGFADARGTLLTGGTAVDGIVTVADSARPTPTATPTPDFTTCVGDCDSGGGVTVNELVRAVNFLLEGSAPHGCVAIDRNDNGRVTVDEIVGAINNALCGCNRTCPTPASTPTPTPHC